VNGIIINITDVNDVRKAVRLRALDINGASTGINGISLLAATNVFVEDCVIDGFTGNGTTSGMGIRMALTATSGNLFVSDTMIHKTVTGIRATTTSGFAVASVRNCNIENNTTGVEAAANGFVTVADSRIASNTGSGLTASASGAQLNARDNVINNNGTAINAAAGSAVRALSNLLLNNNTGFGGTTAVIQTDGQNRNAGSGVAGAPGGGLVTIH
jgi:hypothetical protein